MRFMRTFAATSELYGHSASPPIKRCTADVWQYTK